MLTAEQRSQPPENHRPYRMHGGFVVALCTIAALWIVVDPLTGSHVDSTSRLMRSVTLILISAACTAVIAWLFQQRTETRPDCSATRAFELGYHAGRADAQNESRPSLGVVSEFPSSPGRTGT